MKIFQPIFQMFGGCLLIIVPLFALFFYLVLLIEHPILGLLLTGIIVYTICLIKRHWREQKATTARIEADGEKRKELERQRQMTTYFEKRSRILKQFEHQNQINIELEIGEKADGQTIEITIQID